MAQDTNRYVPKRINVVGTSGSGKSTFSRRLSQTLNIPHVEMDKIFWGPNWRWPPDTEFFAKLQESLEQDSWVLDGNYTRTAPIKWAKVDTIIWLDFPFLKTFYRALTRALRRSLTQDEIWEGTGNRETFRRNFLSKESVLLWTLKTYSSVRKKYEQAMTDPKHSHIRFVRLRSDREIESYLANLNEHWKPLLPIEAKAVLKDLTCPWAIAGGWAIDLFLGRTTRPHSDIDILIRRDDQFQLQRALRDWEMWVADPPGTLRPWKKSEFIGKGLQDIWCRRTKNDPWQLQVMLFDVEEENWVFKRDESIRRPLSEVFFEVSPGYRILAPEVQLLYKSKAMRDKDAADFAASVQSLSASQKAWLKETLFKVYGREHPWSAELSGAR